jgi:hypothetical protein
MSADLFDLLGVDPNVDDAALDRALERRLADLPAADAVARGQVTQAHQVLTDDTTRRLYTAEWVVRNVRTDRTSRVTTVNELLSDVRDLLGVDPTARDHTTSHSADGRDPAHTRRSEPSAQQRRAAAAAAAADDLDTYLDQAVADVRAARLRELHSRSWVWGVAATLYIVSACVASIAIFPTVAGWLGIAPFRITPLSLNTEAPFTFDWGEIGATIPLWTILGAIFGVQYKEWVALRRPSPFTHLVIAVFVLAYITAGWLWMWTWAAIPGIALSWWLLLRLLELVLPARTHRRMRRIGLEVGDDGTVTLPAEDVERIRARAKATRR